MNIYKYTISFFGCLLCSSIAKSQINDSNGDSIKNWTSVIDSLIQQDDNLRRDLIEGQIPSDSLHLKYDPILNDLSQVVIHYRGFFGGGGTAFLFEVKTKKDVKIYYESSHGRYWVAKDIYFKNRKLFFAKVTISTSDQKQNLMKLYDWEEYFKDDKVVWTTNKKQVKKKAIKDVKLFDSIKEGYNLLNDFKPALN